jgi:uncharacterized protein YaaN involved in tellurite resistance
MTDPVGVDVSIPTELPPDVQAQIEATATSFVERLVAAGAGGRAFNRAIAAIERLGDREVRATTQIVGAFHDRPTQAVRELLEENGPLSRNLARLRGAAEDLARAANEGRTTRDGIVRSLPRAEERLGSIVAALDADRGALEHDNAVLAQQERALWAEIQALRRYVALTARLDDQIEERIAATSDVDVAHGEALRTEAQFAVRRRHQELLLQLAVATQGYAALRLIERDNLEVIWALRVATTTTGTALRARVLAAHALSDGGPAVETAVAQLAAASSDILAAIDRADGGRRRTLAEARSASA